VRGPAGPGDAGRRPFDASPRFQLVPAGVHHTNTETERPNSILPRRCVACSGRCLARACCRRSVSQHAGSALSLWGSTRGPVALSCVIAVLRRRHDRVPCRCAKEHLEGCMTARCRSGTWCRRWAFHCQVGALLVNRPAWMWPIAPGLEPWSRSAQCRGCNPCTARPAFCSTSTWAYWPDDYACWVSTPAYSNDVLVASNTRRPRERGGPRCARS
jgi:hypothetical protein